MGELLLCSRGGDNKAASLGLAAADKDTIEAISSSLSCFLSHDRDISISLICYHFPAPC
jgi:hypothetical protein